MNKMSKGLRFPINSDLMFFFTGLVALLVG